MKIDHLSEFSERLIYIGNWQKGSKRPKDKQFLVYYYALGGGMFLGSYDAETDSILGVDKTTTWDTDVEAWYPIPTGE